jgi:hypothetical protein
MKCNTLGTKASEVYYTRNERNERRRNEPFVSLHVFAKDLLLDIPEIIGRIMTDSDC